MSLWAALEHYLDILQLTNVVFLVSLACLYQGHLYSLHQHQN